MNTSQGRYSHLHKEPAGPDDSRPTGYQVLKDEDLLGKLSNLTILVTGATQGLGLETVKQLLKTGAHVYFTARNEIAAAQVVEDIKAEGKNEKDLANAKIDWVKMDNSSLKSVKAAAEDFLKRSKQLNVLINNAGIAFQPHKTTEDGIENTFAVNHISHFALFQYLRPLLLSSSTPTFASRVINVSSGAHLMSPVHLDNLNQTTPITSGFSPLVAQPDDPEGFNHMLAYGQSKTANIWFANEIERRYGSQGLHALSLHPGAIRTGGYDKMEPKIVAKLAPMFQDPNIAKSFKSLEQGAATQIWAAVGKELEGKGGIYLEDVGIAVANKDDNPLATGYSTYAYDEAGAKGLWAKSEEMTGLKDV